MQINMCALAKLKRKPFLYMSIFFSNLLLIVANKMKSYPAYFLSRDDYDCG